MQKIPTKEGFETLPPGKVSSDILNLAKICIRLKIYATEGNLMDWSISHFATRPLQSSPFCFSNRLKFPNKRNLGHAKIKKSSGEKVIWKVRSQISLERPSKNFVKQTEPEFYPKQPIKKPRT